MKRNQTLGGRSATQSDVDRSRSGGRAEPDPNRSKYAALGRFVETGPARDATCGKSAQRAANSGSVSGGRVHGVHRMPGFTWPVQSKAAMLSHWLPVPLMFAGSQPFPAFGPYQVGSQ